MDGAGQPGRSLFFLESRATEKGEGKTAITHRLIKKNDKLLSISDLYTYVGQTGSGCGREMRNVFTEDYTTLSNLTEVTVERMNN